MSKQLAVQAGGGDGTGGDGTGGGGEGGGGEETGDAHEQPVESQLGQSASSVLQLELKYQTRTSSHAMSKQLAVQGRAGRGDGGGGGGLDAVSEPVSPAWRCRRREGSIDSEN